MYLYAVAVSFSTRSFLNGNKREERNAIFLVGKKNGGVGSNCERVKTQALKSYQKKFKLLRLYSLRSIFMLQESRFWLLKN